MFMLFNVIFIIVTGLASGVAITADNARDARQAQQAELIRQECASGLRSDEQCPSGQAGDRAGQAREQWR